MRGPPEPVNPGGVPPLRGWLDGRHSRWGVLLGLGFASVVATMPLALSTAHGSASPPLVASKPRVPAVDVLRTSNAVATGSDENDGAWSWSARFAHPVHLGLVRARFGDSPTAGVPRELHWEALAPDPVSTVCPSPSSPDAQWTVIEGTSQAAWQAGAGVAGATRRSWFVDVDACGLRLVVRRTNAGPPVVREVRAIAGARDVLQDGTASDEGAWPGFSAGAAIDGRYATRWAGDPGASRWVLRVDLPSPEAVDRIRLVLGYDAAGVARPHAGRSYAVTWAPLRYRLEVSEDGETFVPVAFEPMRADGSVLPLRRRLVTLARARTIRAVRMVMTGATGAGGIADPGGVPVVRELAAYRADDRQPILAAPWILSINANPSSQTHTTPGGEVGSDALHARYLQGRFARLIPALRTDDRYARMLGPRGEVLDVPANDDAGEALESIEGDDPALTPELLSQSSPPPIAVLGGSNDWDYAAETGPDPVLARRWHWDPLPDAASGGMGRLAAAVRGRVAPFVGFCGGAQILALLEAAGSEPPSAERDRRLIDRVLSRTSGLPIRGFAQPMDIERAWPGDPHPFRAKIHFEPKDPLFEDLAGAALRSTTASLPESHADAIRPDAFGPGGPLQHLELVATSTVCAPDVEASGPRAGLFPNPSGSGWCDTVPEAFRSKDPSWPVIGAQFHAEQHEFASAAPGDPPEATADPRLFMAGVYEDIVDAYERYAP
ncbi:MAG: discoidin domain-containing protein [Polyangiaceae bacterium]